MKRPISITRGVFKSFSVGLLLVGLGGIVFASVFLYRLVATLPDVNKLKDFQHDLASEVISGDGRKIGEFLTERRYPVKFEAIPKHVIHAFISAEDSKFFEHKGVDFTSIGRAVISNVLRGRYAQGGSTITQQVARSVLLASRKKEITRKVKEILLAFRMEKELSKNEILSLYLSEIYLGHGAYGIGAAALNYFNKRVEDLTLAEASVLAGLPQRPHEWDPFRNPHLAKRRQTYVLGRMVEEKYITQAESDAAKQTALKIYALDELNNSVAPYFTEYVRQHLMKKYGSESILSHGYKVQTTVNVNFQKAAEKALNKGLREVDKRLGWRGVQKRLASIEEREDFLAGVHEGILDKISRVRILPGDREEVPKKLLYDLTPFQAKNSPYFGPTPILENEYYKALVLEVDDAKGTAKVSVGQTTALVAFSTLEWVEIEDKPLKTISQILKPDDIIEVKILKIDRTEQTVLAGLEQSPEIQGALLAYDVQDGKVVAMVGGNDFEASKFNRALQAKRQVGSTFKPLLYAAAMDRGFSPSSLVTDAPIVFKFEGGLDADSQGEAWRPKNYSGKFEGEIPLRLALIRSMNIPTVKLLNEITIDYGIAYARSLGITANLPRDLSIGLGSWSSSLEEIMRAYAIFPRLGKPVELTYITKVQDGSGQVLETSEDARDPAAVKGLQVPVVADPALAEAGLVISPQTAYVMTDMLKGVVREGTGTAAGVVPAAVAGKTGTSNDHRDAWFVGYTPHVLAGVWVGFDKDKPLDPGETGNKAAAPIWAEFMQEVVKAYPKNDFAIPDDIVFAYIDRHTGKPAPVGTQGRVRVAFKQGTVPTRDASNLPRVGEPGIRAMSNTEDPSESPLSTSPKSDEETSDFIREGYDE